MHAAHPDKSDRLRRVLTTLRRARRPLTTLEIITRANVCAVNSCIAELRTHGYEIDCRRSGGVYHYRLVSEPKEIAA